MELKKQDSWNIVLRKKYFSVKSLTWTRTRPLGAYWYEFLLSIFIATWSFHANSSAFCQGASVLAKRNLIRVPIWKHCQTGDGMGAPPKDQRGEAGVSYVPTAGGGGRILIKKMKIIWQRYQFQCRFYFQSVIWGASATRERRKIRHFFLTFNNA